MMLVVNGIYTTVNKAKLHEFVALLEEVAANEKTAVTNPAKSTEKENTTKNTINNKKMKKSELLLNKQWESVDKMLEEFSPIPEISKIACVNAEIEKRSAWQWLFVILGVIVGVICGTIEAEYGIDLDLVWSIIVLFIVAIFAIPALIKGIRSVDDILIQTSTDIYVFKNITYNKKSGKDFNVSFVYEFNKGELHEYYYFGKYLEKLSFFAPFHIKLRDKNKTALDCKQAKGKAILELMSEQTRRKIVKLKDFSF
jgi:hypothetical protein